jgi:ABC-2 type transport system ATP-binding protein
MNPNADGYAVTAHDLERRFGDFAAVDRVSFEIRRGEIFGFLGPNGAGKSTTIRMLCGILRPTGGAGTVAGFDIASQAEEVKARIGYMSQKFSLYEDLTVEENIDFYSGIYSIPAKQKQTRKEWVIEMAGLGDHRRSQTGALAAGWKQRLALGCAILHNPAVLFLDEPTSGVDPISRRKFWDLIYEMSERGVTVFITTHYMDEAEYCDRLGLVYRGKLVACGSANELKTRFMPEDVLELECELPGEILESLESLPEVKDAALFGNSIHIITGDGKNLLKILPLWLKERGTAVRSLEQIPPSLEDVFVSLIETHDRQSAPQTEVKA